MLNKIIKVDSRQASEYYNNSQTSFLYEFDPISLQASQSILYSVEYWLQNMVR